VVNNSYQALRDYGRITIVAIDPDAVTTGTCPVVGVYNDNEVTYSSLTVLVNPALARTDADGNVYVGRGAKSGGTGLFRLLVIPNNTPKNDPFSGILRRNITGSFNKDYYTGSSMAVGTTHIAVGLEAFNGGEEVAGTFTTVPLTTVLNNMNIAATWHGVAGDIWDSFGALPNGSFLIMGHKKASPIWAAVYDPVTNTTKNPVNWQNGAGGIGCGPSAWGCASPSASLGADGNVYITVQRIGGASCPLCSSYIWKLDMTKMQLTGLAGESSATLVPPFYDLQNNFGGATVIADSTGKLALAMSRWGKKVSGDADIGGGTIAIYNAGVWSSSEFGNPSGLATFGGINLLVNSVGGQERLFAVYTAWGNEAYHSIMLNTYVTPLSGTSSRCTPNLTLENGAVFVNSTTISGAVYTKAICAATKYIAIADNSAKPPASIDPTKAKPFSMADGTIKVENLVEGANYIHVQLLDSNNKAIDSWINTSIFVDTAATVGATATLSNTSNGPFYLDSYSMRGSSYMADGYTRSNTGILKFTSVTDPSGLDKYTVDGGSPVTFLPSMVNQSIPVSMSAITSTVGISLTLTDGASNNETRGLRSLTMDVDPPVVSSNPTASFVSAGTGLFTGTLSLSGGSVTDTIYNAKTGKDYWGIWVANAKQSGGVCPADTSTDLRWGAVPIDSASPSVKWNVLNGLKTPPGANDTFCTYVRFLDGAGNASTTAVTATTNIPMTATKVYTPIVFGQR